ncbi:MAG: type II secretion system F family protein [Anaerolineaceae bacterium]|nr:type II secretion system F family protein [Anaerolineaceae bacterium]MCB9098328.1 type II secretion system F family protein [Anaerolineales bacterium]
MDPTTLLLIGTIGIAFIVGAILLVRFGLSATQGAGGSDIQSRLEEYASRSDAPLSLEEIELSQPFSQRVVRPMLVGLSTFFSRLSPSKSREAMELRLQLAGKPYNWGPTEFFGLRIFVALILGVLIFLLILISQTFLIALLSATVATLIGFMLPLLWLRSKTRRRQTEIIKALPDALDLLTIIVEAGMGFDGAMQKVAEKWDNEISKGFAKVVQEMRLGVSRREALRNMDASMGVPDVTTFVAAIIQAEQLGVSIAKILRVQSEQMRIKRRQRAEAEANKAPIKMLFPMVFLIFPALFIILLGPAALVLMETRFSN